MVQAAAVDALSERWLSRIGRFGVLPRAPWSLQLRGEDLLPIHARRLPARLRLGHDGISVVGVFEALERLARSVSHLAFSADAIDRGNSLGWRAGHCADLGYLRHLRSRVLQSMSGRSDRLRLLSNPRAQDGPMTCSFWRGLAEGWPRCHLRVQEGFRCQAFSLSSPRFGSFCGDAGEVSKKMESLAWRKFVRQAVVLAAAAIAFQPGRYAVEAGCAEPDATSNLAQVQVARVREFREKNLLLADEDFAFTFSS